MTGLRERDFLGCRAGLAGVERSALRLTGCGRQHLAVFGIKIVCVRRLCRKAGGVDHGIVAAALYIRGCLQCDIAAVGNAQTDRGCSRTAGHHLKQVDTAVRPKQCEALGCHVVHAGAVKIFHAAADDPDIDIADIGIS